MNKYLDMDGNELNIGDTVFVAINTKEIVRAKIESIDKYNSLILRTLKNRLTHAMYCTACDATGISSSINRDEHKHHSDI